jgi:hypothetical protein
MMDEGWWSLLLSVQSSQSKLYKYKYDTGLDVEWRDGGVSVHESVSKVFIDHIDD